MVCFPFYFFFECWLEFLIGVGLINFMQELYNPLKIDVLSHSHHEGLNSYQEKYLKVVQVLLVEIGQIIHYMFLDLVYHLNRFKPQILCLFFLESASIFVTNIDDAGHELIEPADAWVFHFQILEWDVSIYVNS